eukprot:7296507-Prymnesium_polylepis.1
MASPDRTPLELMAPPRTHHLPLHIHMHMRTPRALSQYSCRADTSTVTRTQPCSATNLHPQPSQWDWRHHPLSLAALVLARRTLDLETDPARVYAGMFEKLHKTKGAHSSSSDVRPPRSCWTRTALHASELDSNCAAC